MRRKTTPTKKAEKPSEIRVEVLVHGEKKVLREPAPEGFPPKLLPHLADYLGRGFKAGINTLYREEIPLLEEFAKIPGLGRPIDKENEREGREAAKLRKKKKLTFGELALQVCRYRKEPGHRCEKKCADRIRQAFEQYESREYLKHLERGE